MSMDKSMVLQALPDLEIRLNNNGAIQFCVNGRWLLAGQHALAILGAFQQPCSIDAAIKQLGTRARGKQDWMDLTSTLAHLHDSGALVSTERAAFSSSNPGAYDHPSIHVRMLNDERRTEAFITAIKATVRPGDVVVDIGTGTGVLALAAAQAGAKKVYAIESSPIADSAQALFAANGYGKTIELVRGWSTQIDLPERCDVLVGELLGNDPFSEQLNEITLDAIERLLKENYRLVPEKVEVAVTALEAPASFLDQRTFTAQVTQKWSSQYGMDFTPLAREFRQTQLEYIRPQKAGTWAKRSEHTPYLSVDLYQREFPDMQGDVHLEITSAGRVNALLLHYCIGLCEEISLDLAPDCAEETNHWLCPLCLLQEPLEVERGNTLHIQTTRRGFSAPGSWKIKLET